MKNESVHRRTFLKATGALSALAGGAGLGAFGYQAGKDPLSHTGCETFEGACQTIDRTRWECKEPHYKKIGETSRPDARVEVVFMRYGMFRRYWKDETGVDGLPEPLRGYYKDHPDVLDLDLQLKNEISEKLKQDHKKYSDQYILSEAWSNAMGAARTRPVTEPPEKSDFQGVRKEPLKFKDPRKTSNLIKKISQEFGSVLTGITRLNPDWVYKYPMGRRGFDRDKPIEVPKHWEFAIVVGTPMSWDPLYANPTYGTSYDAYSKSRIVGHRLASFIKQLGYPARPHTPGSEYDLMVPPIMVDAGLGEQGRHSVVITPELGCNFRPAVVTTNLPMEPDRPIQFGVQKFCESCMICADNCPSGSITKGGKKKIRGYERYPINSASCHNFWNSCLGNMGCRLCIATCPYTRKSNWLHRTALHVTMNDPTGLSHKALTGLQKSFYPGPDPKKYYIPSLGGENATYRQPPWWLKTEDFIEI